MPGGLLCEGGPATTFAERVAMNHEPVVFSLIVKVTIEGAAQGPRHWHGQVTHVPSGRQTYFSRSFELGDTLRQYLRQEGFVCRRRGWLLRTLGWARRRFG